MKRRQKKIQEFLERPEGRRQGRHHRAASTARSRSVNEKSVQVQIADKVRIEIAAQAVGGYQGQEPVVPESAAACRP